LNDVKLPDEIAYGRINY